MTVSEPKQHPCPKCGYEMCEQFDDKPGPNGITLAVPNGKYICYRHRAAAAEPSREAPEAQRNMKLDDVESKDLLRGALYAAVRLAITRHNIELEADTATEEEVAEDAAGACFGEECCDDLAIPEVTELLRRTAGHVVLLEALRKMTQYCLSDQESRLLMMGCSAQFADPKNENSVALQKRCDQIEAALAEAEAAIQQAERGQ